MEEPKNTIVLSQLKERKPIDIEFHDLSFSVPQGRKGTKKILKDVTGQFKAGELTAIMGPSGAGKSTLLNILAAYKVSGSSGSILINGEPRKVRNFRKISRYIMQDDAIQPRLTVEEIMMIAANLKLPKNSTIEEKKLTINEILTDLRLAKARKTMTNKLSGGERKRLSIALELINNPPVIFLDEPTTGLDDLSSSQCVKLLKCLAEGGRTVICSIHTPNYKAFNTFDQVYILSEGYTVYQGKGSDVVPYLANIGLHCPTHYNPADYIIEVSSGEYGNYLDTLVAAAENNKNSYYKRNYLQNDISPTKEIFPIISEKPYKETTEVFENLGRASSLEQFKIILFRMWKQMYRDKSYLLLKVMLTFIIGIIVGNMFLGMGQDGSKTIFNFGFYYTCLIKFLYIPMMPVLLSFPMEVQLVKRECFNKWYKLGPYFWALTISTLPLTFVLGAAYVSMVYVLTDQPMEWSRFIQFYFICMLTSLISESFGMIVSSNLSLINAMFVGPVLAVPLMLLAVYGAGYYGDIPIPFLILLARKFTYLRYSLEGLSAAMLFNREDLECPTSEDLCYFVEFRIFNKFIGIEDVNYWEAFLVLCAFLFVYRLLCFYLLKQRLRPNKLFAALKQNFKILNLYLN